MSAPSALPTLLTSRRQSLDASTGLARGRGMVKCPMELPEAYPAPICVHNTFIDAAVERSPSLEPFYREREVSTCPSAHIGRLKSLFQEPADCDMEEQTRECPETSAASGAAAGQVPVMVLSLAEALRQPPAPQVDARHGNMKAEDSGAEDVAQSLETLPSVGSAAHLTGRCKPCAFLYTKGCESKFACEFCHLCEPGEKKRRKKEKLEARRSMHKDRKQASAASLPQKANLAVNGFRQPMVRS